jgi:hypothetical protein
MKAQPLSLATAVLLLFMIYSCQKGQVKPVFPVKAIAKVDSSAVTIPRDSVKLTGTGGPGNTITGYLWSQVSGPSEATIINESSQTATAKNLIAGSYLFQLLVVDKSGESATDTVRVTVKSPKVMTLDLSPANNPNEIALTLLGSGDITNKTSIEEPLSAWTINGVPVTVRDLLKFDLSTIPANATIVSADLHMYSDTIPLNGDLIHANYGNDNSFVVQQVASAWDVASVNWFNQPAGLIANQVVVPNTAEPYLNLDINVTNIVASMVNNNQNYGFKLTLQSEVEYTSRIFCSSYYSVASRHPRLVVQYEVH